MPNDLPDWYRAVALSQYSGAIDVDNLSYAKPTTARLAAPTQNQSAYLAGSTGSAIELVAPPPPTVIKVIQFAVAGSSDGQTVKVSLNAAPTPGNLLVLACQAYNYGHWAAIPGWTVDSDFSNNYGVFYIYYRTVQSGDPVSWDLTLITAAGETSFMAVCLYEMANVSGPVGGTLLSSNATSGLTTSIAGVAASENYVLPLYAGFTSYTGGSLTGGTITDTLSTPPTIDGFISNGPLPGRSYLGELGFSHGPVLGDAQAPTWTYTSTGTGTQTFTQTESVLKYLAPTTAPPSYEVIRVWELFVQGASTDTPEIVRSDSGATLLRAQGGYPARLRFPHGMVLNEAAQLNATSAAAADFGVVYDLLSQ